MVWKSIQCYARDYLSCSGSLFRPLRMRRLRFLYCRSLLRFIKNEPIAESIGTVLSFQRLRSLSRAWESSFSCCLYSYRTFATCLPFDDPMKQKIIQFLFHTPLFTWHRNPGSWRIARWWIRDDRRVVQQALVRLISIAQSERLDLASMVKHYAAEHRGLTKYRLNKFAKRLQQDSSFIEAIEQTPRFFQRIACLQCDLVFIRASSPELSSKPLRTIDRHSEKNIG